MGVVGKIRVPGGSLLSAPITSTLFGRCETKPGQKDKIVKITDDSFDESGLMDGMTLKVYFKYGNTCDAPRLVIVKQSYTGESQDPIVPPTANEKLVTEKFIMNSRFIAQNDSESIQTSSNYLTTVWDKGGIINFTYSAYEMSNTGTPTPYWIIDNQALASNCSYGYMNNNSQYYIDEFWSTINDPTLKNGRYIYKMNGGGGVLPTVPTSPAEGKEGILEVVSCPHGGVNYIIENWTFHDEPQTIYRRIHSGVAWSPWFAVGGSSVNIYQLYYSVDGQAVAPLPAGYDQNVNAIVVNNTGRNLNFTFHMNMQGSNPTAGVYNTGVATPVYDLLNLINGQLTLAPYQFIKITQSNGASANSGAYVFIDIPGVNTTSGTIDYNGTDTYSGTVTLTS